MSERPIIFKYETRDEAKTIPCTDLHVSADGAISVSIDREAFESIFGNLNKAINAYNRSVTHG